MYDIEVEDLSNKYLQLAESSLESITEALVPGTFWVDFLPFLKHVPAWMPGADFKRKALHWKVSSFAIRDAPWDAARMRWVGLCAIKSRKIYVNNVTERSQDGELYC